ncbi:Rab proteins geranylgeranyltransferase component A [Elasticomyces elasticus]|uniref:Rab proteins geranylgeranyltransferase n=1 Tax=Exophiala sideris TaxID=1016849 RepID=A0ABR0JMY9_9EURO|nr:Rab proteins geranylgeranyltransferase component A [Elasticomyces elasticus]KAK5032280.1 Rab proteins geranylgeranyltransferase component A [Exophiala sideris]KAK5036278.1 Rab proteins geranylgeranyltransferase component A [Exophiala sideris]KAK5066661.1 Rab proteins geranylgeranyltransferase component A [Exophiala sideris]KAK5180483.1 Rab proteins geranylgeranyltransferase component A [Eurotiomycetes sp. CCFEE 6388]
MESLSDEVWDVVIAGTGIPQSLLALSLSRSGKKVLHVDRHGYYGGNDAGLSLQDAEDWVEDLKSHPVTVFKDASISKPSDDILGPSRSYTLSLNPQIIYAQSKFLPTLVSSKIHAQLEFLAVGSWWVHRHGALHKIPSTREDVFNDESLSMKDKRGLMKFLRYVLQDGDETTTPLENEAHMSLQTALETTFKVPASLQSPLLALALSPVPATSIPFDKALARIRRHMRSMGYFGPGFGAVIAKYGGNSEISQVACRAGAVGGGVYLLGQELRTFDTDPAGTNDADTDPFLQGILADGTKIKSRFLAGTFDDIPNMDPALTRENPSNAVWRSINIVADPLQSLFPQTSDNGPIPAAAIVLVDTGEADKSPIYLQIHSEDTGECPNRQCIIYGSLRADDSASKQRLEAAVRSFLETQGVATASLWSLTYTASAAAAHSAVDLTLSRPRPSVLVFPPQPYDIAFPDNIKDVVKDAWKTILGSDVEDDSFLRFAEREHEVDD